MSEVYEKDILIVEIDFRKDVGVRRIEPKSIQFPAKKEKTAERYMLPLVLSWASTVHMMLDSTVDCYKIEFCNLNIYLTVFLFLKKRS
jgi:hypothetical protein